MIELRNIGKKYPLTMMINAHATNNFNEFWALRSVSFAVSRGEILGVIGRNGAGKTTMLNIIAGGLHPSEGSLLADGKILGLFNLGVGFQDELTGKENIFLNAAIIGASRKELDNKLDSIIEFSELGDFINMPLGTYSQGMRLRLGFSIIANLDFDILVIDEILAVGDALFQSKCYQRLMDFRRAGKTLIISTQDMDLIERLSDKAALLDHGRLVFYGRPQEAIDRYRALLNTEKFFVGLPRHEQVLFEDTEKWARDLSDWGKELGTKEVVIESVDLINKFGIKTDKIKSGDHLKIKVKFRAKNTVKDPHFGVAIFRSDGAYCYGPNTAFDGYQIEELKPGRGYFTLNYKQILLAPGDYMISVAIWDKNEKLPFIYHNGCYKLRICGQVNRNKELLDLPFKINPLNYFSKINLTRHRSNDIIYGDIFSDTQDRLENNGIKIESIILSGPCGQEKEVFFTNESVALGIKLAMRDGCNKSHNLSVILKRDDDICCWARTLNISKAGQLSITFPGLPLLPGKYRFMFSIWGYSGNKLSVYDCSSHAFRMVFNRRDHGTIYLKHYWKIGA